MRVRDIMTVHMAFCMPEKTVDEVAGMMVVCDCGAIPVVDPVTRKAVGIVTDRDIVCRAVAKGLDPARVRVEEIMTMPLVAVRAPDDTAARLSIGLRVVRGLTVDPNKQAYLYWLTWVGHPDDRSG